MLVRLAIFDVLGLAGLELRFGPGRLAARPRAVRAEKARGGDKT